MPPTAIAAYLLSNEGRVKSRESPGLAGTPFECSPKKTYLDTYISAQQAMQQPFDEYRGQSINLGIEQGLSTDILLMAPSVREPRFIDSVDDDIDVPRGGCNQDGKEFEPLIAEPAASRTRYCAELVRVLKKDRYSRTVLSLQRRFFPIWLSDWDHRKSLTRNVSYSNGYLEKVYHGCCMWEILLKSCGQSLERMSGEQGLHPCQQVVGLTPSEAEAERVISIQRDLVGTTEPGLVKMFSDVLQGKFIIPIRPIGGFNLTISLKVLLNHITFQQNNQKNMWAMPSQSVELCYSRYVGIAAQKDLDYHFGDRGSE
jgi:hypothetical protein